MSSPASARRSSRRSAAIMGTIVTIEVVHPDGDATDLRHSREAIDRAFGWFLEVEAICTRFDPRSELRQLTDRVGVPVPASPVLFEALQFALAVAEASGGAFDPTVGRAMEARGFDREHRTGRTLTTPIEAGAPASHRDVHLDPGARTVTLARPLLLDLGAVAKGLAVDMAARELAPFTDFAVDAGGDLYLGGSNGAGAPWAVGLRDPRDDDGWFDVVRVSNAAVCTSGDYERRTADGLEHHILDPRTDWSAAALVSVTVVAPTAMVADGLATAAFVLGPADGLHLLESQGVNGLVVTASLERRATPDFRSDHIRG